MRLIKIKNMKEKSYESIINSLITNFLINVFLIINSLIINFLINE